LSFLENELRPKIEGDLRTNGNSTLVGVSFGGLFTAYTLITRPELFDHYVILDATYVWDDNYLNKILAKPKQKISTKNISVHLALANNDHIGEHGVANRRWGNEFIKQLESKSSDTFTVHSDYFPNERHGTVEFLGWYHGMLKLFGPQA
jgi:predicted alpha/beta superfamily hydrolase